MAAFTRTNLPPIVRLGGSADSLYHSHKGSADNRHIPQRVPTWCLPSTTITMESIEVPASESEAMPANRSRRTRRQKSAQFELGPAH